jgi:ring-1,2-phenylacetyl-CoA epoxidase subunit PaaE
MSTKFYSLEVAEIRRETPGCVSVAFTVPTSIENDFAFEAGQYLTIKKTIQNQLRLIMVGPKIATQRTY